MFQKQTTLDFANLQYIPNLSLAINLEDVWI